MADISPSPTDTVQKIELPSNSLTDDPTSATWALRLGLAFDALLATSRFYLASVDAPGPGGERDRMWAFLISAAYLHETIVTLHQGFKVVEALAIKGGADEELLKRTRQVISGKSGVGTKLAKMRNELVFHFTKDAVAPFVAGNGESNVCWLEGAGDTRAQVLHRASLNALFSSVFPTGQGMTEEMPESSAAQFKELIAGVHETKDALLDFLDAAIAGHVLSCQERQAADTTL